MKAIISPYEPVIDAKGDTVYMPSVVIDTEAQEFSSSDMPSSIVDVQEGERLIVMSADKHAEAVALGYTEVEVDLWQS